MKPTQVIFLALIAVLCAAVTARADTQVETDLVKISIRLEQWKENLRLPDNCHLILSASGYDKGKSYWHTDELFKQGDAQYHRIEYQLSPEFPPETAETLSLPVDGRLYIWEDDFPAHPVGNSPYIAIQHLLCYYYAILNDAVNPRLAQTDQRASLTYETTDGTRHSYLLDSASGMILESQRSDTSGANHHETKLTTFDLVPRITPEFFTRVRARMEQTFGRQGEIRMAVTGV